MPERGKAVRFKLAEPVLADGSWNASDDWESARTAKSCLWDTIAVPLTTWSEHQHTVVADVKPSRLYRAFGLVELVDTFLSDQCWGLLCVPSGPLCGGFGFEF